MRSGSTCGNAGRNRRQVTEKAGEVAPKRGSDLSAMAPGVRTENPKIQRPDDTFRLLRLVSHKDDGADANLSGKTNLAR
ncbi:hypothetical protein GCM10027419_47610 [Pandoraea terrae]